MTATLYRKPAPTGFDCETVDAQHMLGPLRAHLEHAGASCCRQTEARLTVFVEGGAAEMMERVKAWLQAKGCEVVVKGWSED